MEVAMVNGDVHIAEISILENEDFSFGFYWILIVWLLLPPRDACLGFHGRSPRSRTCSKMPGSCNSSSDWDSNPVPDKPHERLGPAHPLWLRRPLPWLPRPAPHGPVYRPLACPQYPHRSAPWRSYCRVNSPRTMTAHPDDPHSLVAEWSEALCESESVAMDEVCHWN